MRLAITVKSVNAGMSVFTKLSSTPSNTMPLFLYPLSSSYAELITLRVPNLTSLPSNSMVKLPLPEPLNLAPQPSTIVLAGSSTSYSPASRGNSRVLYPLYI